MQVKRFAFVTGVFLGVAAFAATNVFWETHSAFVHAQIFEIVAFTLFSLLICYGRVG
jgi:hypothetical protein